MYRPETERINNDQYSGLMCLIFVHSALCNTYKMIWQPVVSFSQLTAARARPQCNTAQSDPKPVRSLDELHFQSTNRRQMKVNPLHIIRRSWKKNVVILVVMTTATKREKQLLLLCVFWPLRSQVLSGPGKRFSPLISSEAKNLSRKWTPTLAF